MSELRRELGIKLTDAEMHEALACEKCGYDRYDSALGYTNDVERPCSEGNCIEYACRQCGHSNSGMGPVGCACQAAS